MHSVSRMLLSIIPELVVSPLTDQLKRRLRTESIFAWHVKVIDEANSLALGVLRLVLVTNSSLKVTLNDILDTVRCGTS